MPLPQQVVEQLNQDKPRTPGWSSGILLFSGSILLIVVLIYAGLRFGYEPVLNSQLASAESQLNQAGKSISPEDEASLVTFYSQISNIQSLMKNHIFFSQFLTWLEANTEANIYYTSMAFTSGDQVTLAGIAKTQADIVQQMAVFEASSDISAVTLSNATFSAAQNAWTFNVVLTMQPSMLLWTSGSSARSVQVAPAAPAATITASTTAATTTAATTTTL